MNRRYPRIAAIFLSLSMAACTQPGPRPLNNVARARVTFYHGHEDRWGTRIASSKHGRAKEGTTIAAERKIPFGQKVSIPALGGLVGDGVFEVQDRGSMVGARKVAHGHPHFDVFVRTKKKMNRLVRTLPDYLPFKYL